MHSRLLHAFLMIKFVINCCFFSLKRKKTKNKKYIDSYYLSAQQSSHTTREYYANIIKKLSKKITTQHIYVRLEA